MGLNLFKDEQNKKFLEKADLEGLIQNIQSQIKDTKNLIEVIDLGNKLVFKEYQKMGNENTVCITLIF
jgi:predicted DCC family thiol-disulfide oxidoreductase YuxK